MDPNAAQPVQPQASAAPQPATPAQTQPAAPAAPTTVPPGQQQKHGKPIKLILAVIMLLVVGIGIFSFKAFTKPAAVVKAPVEEAAIQPTVAPEPTSTQTIQAGATSNTQLQAGDQTISSSMSTIDKSLEDVNAGFNDQSDTLQE